MSDQQLDGSDLAELLAAAGLPPATGVRRLLGGRNNLLFRVDTSAGPLCVKRILRRAGHDRLAHEVAFARAAAGRGIPHVPRLLAALPEAGLLGVELVDAAPPEPTFDLAALERPAAAFFARLAPPPTAAELDFVPMAVDASLSLDDHLRVVADRIARLQRTARQPHQPPELAEITEAVSDALERIRSVILEQAARRAWSLSDRLPPQGWLLSPSDVGYHNCLVGSHGVWFVDFEYAGWDDPAKAIADFVTQPDYDVPPSLIAVLAQAVAPADSEPLEARASLVAPLHRLKWTCIVLNDFVADVDTARAVTVGGRDERRNAQLEKAWRLLDRLEPLRG